jgi:hypothetical protein
VDEAGSHKEGVGSFPIDGYIERGIERKRERARERERERKRGGSSMAIRIKHS